MPIKTRSERKKHLRKKYFRPKEKTFVLSAFVILLVVLVTVFAWSLQQNMDPILPVLALVGILTMFMFALFFIDMYFWESE